MLTGHQRRAVYSRLLALRHPNYLYIRVGLRNAYALCLCTLPMHLVRVLMLISEALTANKIGYNRDFSPSRNSPYAREFEPTIPGPEPTIPPGHI
jgi:hypothetical protein